MSYLFIGIIVGVAYTWLTAYHFRNVGFNQASDQWEQLIVENGWTTRERIDDLKVQLD